jgi:hypothetical protein
MWLSVNSFRLRVCVGVCVGGGYLSGLDYVMELKQHARYNNEEYLI